MGSKAVVKVKFRPYYIFCQRDRRYVTFPVCHRCDNHENADLLHGVYCKYRAVFSVTNDSK